MGENDDLLKYADELRKLGRRPEVILERAALAEAAVQEWVTGAGLFSIEDVVRQVPVFVFSPTVQTYLYNLRNRAAESGSFDPPVPAPGDEDARKELRKVGDAIGDGAPATIAGLARMQRASEWLSRVNAMTRDTKESNVLNAYEAVAGEIDEESPGVFRRGEASGVALRERIKRDMVPRPGELVAVENQTVRKPGKRGPTPKRK